MLCTKLMDKRINKKSNDSVFCNFLRITKRQEKKTETGRQTERQTWDSFIYFILTVRYD